MFGQKCVFLILVNLSSFTGDKNHDSNRFELIQLKLNLIYLLCLNNS